MSEAGAGGAAVGGAGRAHRRRAFPEPFWRSLFYFNVYRLLVALLLLLIVAIWGTNAVVRLARPDAVRRRPTSPTSLFSVACFVLISARRHFNLQLTLQVAADIVFIVVLIYASGGISSGLGLLLLTTLAGAGLISRGRLTLFYAALAAHRACCSSTPTRC